MQIIYLPLSKTHGGGKCTKRSVARPKRSRHLQQNPLKRALSLTVLLEYRVKVVSCLTSNYRTSVPFWEPLYDDLKILHEAI